MIEPLREAQQRWVDAVFATLRTEDKVAQLLISTLGPMTTHREAVDAFPCRKDARRDFCRHG